MIIKRESSCFTRSSNFFFCSSPLQAIRKFPQIQTGKLSLKENPFVSDQNQDHNHESYDHETSKLESKPKPKTKRSPYIL